MPTGPLVRIDGDGIVCWKDGSVWRAAPCDPANEPDMGNEFEVETAPTQRLSTRRRTEVLDTLNLPEICP